MKRRWLMSSVLSPCPSVFMQRSRPGAGLDPQCRSVVGSHCWSKGFPSQVNVLQHQKCLVGIFHSCIYLFIFLQKMTHLGFIRWLFRHRGREKASCDREQRAVASSAQAMSDSQMLQDNNSLCLPPLCKSLNHIRRSVGCSSALFSLPLSHSRAGMNLLGGLKAKVSCGSPQYFCLPSIMQTVISKVRTRGFHKEAAGLYTRH